MTDEVPTGQRGFEPERVGAPDPGVERPGLSVVDDPRIADAIDRLGELSTRPPAEHVEVYEEVHAVLQDALADAQGEAGRTAGGDARS